MLLEVKKKQRKTLLKNHKIVGLKSGFSVATAIAVAIDFVCEIEMSILLKYCLKCDSVSP